MQPCCLGLIFLLSIPLMAWIIHLYRKGFFSTFLGRFIIWGVLLLFLTIAYHPILKHWVGYTKLESAAQFGDQYGALNCFISGLAFIGLVLTLLIQREDLNLQRKEMRESREEFEKQTKQFTRQTTLMQTQINEERAAAKEQITLHEKSTWMQETMGLISRFADEIKSLECTCGDTPESINTVSGKQVVNLLYDAYTEQCLYDFMKSQLGEKKLTIPRFLEKQYFCKKDAFHQAIISLYPLMNQRFLITERISNSDHLSSSEIAQLLMFVPLDSTDELKFLTFMFEPAWKRMWIQADREKRNNIQNEIFLLSQQIRIDAQKVAILLTNRANSFVLKTLNKIAERILKDPSKNFDENLEDLDDENLKVAYLLFNDFLKILKEEASRQTCQVFFYNELIRYSSGLLTA